MMSWLIVAALFAVAWRLSQPELSQWLNERLAARSLPQWSGAFTPRFSAVKLYQNPRDLTLVQREAQVSAELLKQLELLGARCALMLHSAPHLSIDLRLCVVAELVGELLARGHQATRAQELRGLCEHVGLVYPLPQLALIPYSELGGGAQALLPFEATLLDALERARAEGAPKVALGLAQVRLEGGEPALLLLTQRRACELQPFPRQLMGELGLSLSGRAEVRGQLTLWVTTPRGEVKRLPVTRSERGGGAFSSSLSNLTPGAHLLELTAEALTEERSHRVAAPRSLMLASVYINTKLPKEVSLMSPARPSALASLNRWRVRQALERARQPFNLPPLKVSRALCKLAERLLMEREGTPYLGYASLPSALEASASMDLALISGVWGHDPHSLASQWLDTPSQRALLLDQRVTELGLSVQKTPDGQLKAALILSARPTRLRVERDRGEVYKLVQSARRAQGVARLPQSELLEQLAQEVAEALARGQFLPHEAQQHAQHLCAERFGEELPLIIEATPVAQPSLLRESEAWVEQPLEVGAGLAQRDDSAPIWVVVALRVRQRSAIGDLSLIRAQLDEATRAEEARKRAHMNKSLTRRLTSTKRSPRDPS